MNFHRTHTFQMSAQVRLILAAVPVLLALLLNPAAGFAADVSLTASDPGGTSSLTSAGQWSDGQPPNATNNYYTSAYFARTPTGSASVTFAGNSLTLQAPEDQGSPMRSIIYKGSGGNVYTINNLTNAGGIINSGAGNVAAPTFAGNAMYVVSNSTIQADQGSFIIGYPLFGSADMTNTSGQARTITYTNDNSGFTGRFIINNNVTVAFNSPRSAPGNPSVSTPDQIDLGAGCTLLDNAGVSLTNANGGITLEGNATINSSAPTGTVTVISEPITDNSFGYNLIKRGGGVLTLADNNTSFSGGVTVYGITAGGQLNINSATALGTGIFAIMSGNNVILDNTSGAALVLAGNNSQVWSNSFAFAGSSSLDMGNGPVTLGAAVAVVVSNNTFSVGSISDNGFGYSLTKAGAGTLALNGGGSYSGATTVADGTLAITGSGSLSSTNITLASATAVLDVAGVGGMTMSGSQALGGLGTVSGALADNFGTFIVPGGNNNPGTLTINGNLTLNGSGSLNFDLGSSTTPGGGVNDLIVVNGGLNIAGPTTLNLFGAPVTGTYTLIQYTSFSGDAANISVPPGFTITNDTSAKAIELIVSHVPANLTWRGDGSGNVWDTGITANWLQSGTNQIFLTGDSAVFDDTGSANPPVNISGSVSPGAVTVNASQTYDFTGGAIAAGSVAKSGTGTLILENNNTYAGPTVITGGAVQIGNPNTGGTTGSLGAGSVTNDASLVLDRSDAVNLPSPIYGSGSVTMALGNVTASGSNYYTGATLINSGVTYLQNAAGLGATNGNISVASGAQLYVTANVDVGANPLTLVGSGDGNGALRKGGAGVTAFNGAVTLTGDTSINVDGGSTLNLTNAAGIDGATANANLTFGGSGAGNVNGPVSLGTAALTVSGGAWTVSATNHYTGKTVLNGGTLFISDVNALGSVSTFTPDYVSLNGGSLGAATNVTFDDGLRGFTANGSSGGFNVASGSTLTISNDVTGFGSLTKYGPGTLALIGSNSFAGTFHVDSTSNSGNDGFVRLASPYALANVPVTPGTPTIYQGNNNGGFSTLQLDGTAGNITVAQEIQMACRNNTNVNLESVVGSNTISGNIDVIIGGADIYLQCDSGTLNIAGSIQYLGSLTGSRTYDFQGAGDEIISGPIVNSVNGAPISIAKAGAGAVTLSADNSYGNTTTVRDGLLRLAGSITSTGGVSVAGGTLGGTGVINDAVTVQSAGTVSPGPSAGLIGALTINGPLTNNGTLAMDLNKSGSTLTGDAIQGITTMEYGGTLQVNLSGSTLATNDSFQLFSAGSYSGAFAAILPSAPGSGLAWNTNTLATDGTLRITTGPAIPTNPTNITASVSGNTLQLSWPADHTGWELQSNAVSLTATNSWYPIPNSTTTNSVSLTIDPAAANVFYRMRLSQ